MRTIEENKLIDAANSLAGLVESMIKGKDINQTDLMIALNEFRMAQVQADDKLQQELEEMLKDYEKDLQNEIKSDKINQPIKRRQ